MGSNSIQKTGWIWISAVAFLLTLAASAILIIFGKQLEVLGISGNFYYIVLVPLGLSCAAFLAGAMKSYASFKSNAEVTYGEINLTGPVVIFALVVVGGFVMPSFGKKPEFDVKVRVVNPDLASTSFNSGSIILYVGKEPKRGNIHDGEVTFYNIPAIYNNKKAKILVSIDDYQLAAPGEVMINGKEDYIELPVVRTKQSMSTQLTGSVLNEKDAPVKHAFIDVASGLSTGYTDEHGDFALTVPQAAGQKVPLKILMNDVLLFNANVTLSSTVPLNLKVQMHP